MSGKTPYLKLPDRWLKCPRKADDVLVNCFMTFKTPLGPMFNEKVPDIDKFTPAILFSYLQSRKIKLGLWIDLTNTDRYYDKNDVTKMGCKYVKMNCQGHGGAPTPEQTKSFIELVDRFKEDHPEEIVAVHCTHGFNRTGFLCVAYMVTKLYVPVDGAIKAFAKVRPPGIYKQDYLDELYDRYKEDGDELGPPLAPERPDWCFVEQPDSDDDEEEQSNSSNSSNKQKHKKHKKDKENTKKKDIFMPGVVGVEPFNEQPLLSKVQREAQRMCGWNKTGFPGSQPVSMDCDNVTKLLEKPFRVSWKADGVRYMMLILDKDQVFMLDRDNCAFRVHNLSFRKKDNLNEHLKNTLLDGEMVIDKVNGNNIHRYLIYDIICIEGYNIGKDPFYPDRYQCIDVEICKPRAKSIELGMINKTKEPFKVSIKYFWDVKVAHRLLEEKFTKTLTHEPDGLIFQPSTTPYKPGACDELLKWKPIELNSIDFLLKIEQEDAIGFIPKKVGNLYVGQVRAPVTQIKLTKVLRTLDKKIIECRFDFEKGEWVFMRERTDKSFPNSFNTYTGVIKSLEKPVLKEDLFKMIEQQCPNDSELMPPPAKRRAY